MEISAASSHIFVSGEINNDLLFINSRPFVILSVEFWSLISFFLISNKDNVDVRMVSFELIISVQPEL